MKKYSRKVGFDLNVQEGVKPCECNICGARFTQKSSLRRHTSTHEDEKSFQCSFCESTFKHEFGLAFHISTIHEGKTQLKSLTCRLECFTILSKKTKQRQHFYKGFRTKSKISEKSDQN